QLVGELLVLAFLRRRERFVAQLELDVLVLQSAQPLVGVGDLVDRLEHLRLELGFDRGERERVLEVVVVHVGVGDGGFLARIGGAVAGGGLERRRAGRRGRRRRCDRGRRRGDRSAGGRRRAVAGASRS